jgi:uncharacterized membrane protein
MKTKSFQQQIDDGQLCVAIREAEQNTSGEIRVFISRFPTTDPLADARREFDRLGMKRTPLRNAVLLYFAPESQQFAIIGDENIHFRCGEAFWKAVAGEMEAELKHGRITAAILAGIQRAGLELARHFPRQAGDRDDLPNTVERN